LCSICPDLLIAHLEHFISNIPENEVLGESILMILGETYGYISISKLIQKLSFPYCIGFTLKAALKESADNDFIVSSLHKSLEMNLYDKCNSSIIALLHQLFFAD
jgi:hypothetical protein